ncbi:MAG TPA: transglutaminase-like domain-containing protein [Cellvibrionaceae bacterium]
MFTNSAFLPTAIGRGPISNWRQALSIVLAVPSCAALLSLWLPMQLAVSGGLVASCALAGQWLLARNEGDQSRILLSSQWSLLVCMLLSLAAIWWQGPLAALTVALSLGPGWAWFSSRWAFTIQLVATGTSLLLALCLGQEANLSWLCLLYLPGLWLCLLPPITKPPAELPSVAVKRPRRGVAVQQSTTNFYGVVLGSRVLMLGLFLCFTCLLWLLSPRFQGAAWLPLANTPKLTLSDSHPLPAANLEEIDNQLQQQWLLSSYVEPKTALPPSAFPAFDDRFAINQLPEQPTTGPVLARVKSPQALNLQVSRFDYFDGTHWANTAQRVEPVRLLDTGLNRGEEGRLQLRIRWLSLSAQTLAVPGGWQWLDAPSEALILGAQNLSLPALPPEGFSYKVSSHGLALDNHNIAQRTGVLHPNYLQIPDTLKKPLQDWSNANLPELADAWQKARWLEHHLQTQYGADRAGVLPSYKRDPIVFFLQEQRAGRSETAASTLTLLLRNQGIPARLSCGWALMQRNPFTGLFDITQAQAHCYTEAYINNHGWVELEPSALFASRSSSRVLSLGVGVLLSYLHNQHPWLAFTLKALCSLLLLALCTAFLWRFSVLAWQSPPVKRFRLKRLAAEPVTFDDVAAQSLDRLIRATELIGYHFPAGAGIHPWACLWQTLIPQFDAERFCIDYYHYHFGLNTQGDITAEQQALLKKLSELPWAELTKWVVHK